MNANPTAESQARDPRLGDALERVYESSQNVLLTRIDLLVAEVRALLREALLSVIGALIVLGGVSWLSYALFRQLDTALPTAAAAALVGVVEGAIGALLLLRIHRPDEPEEAS